jgi:hypothetical protein
LDIHEELSNMRNRYGYEDERRGGGYGIGGAERGYNQGGYGGFGRESWGDEPRHFGRSRGEELQREPRGGWDLHQGLHRREWGRPEDFRSGAMEWTARARGPGKAPKGYTRSDERIREDICERLMVSPYDSSDVEVSVSRGEVTLTGTVRSRPDKWGIEDVAEAILGVQDVHNQIRVNRGEGQTSGTTLAGDTGHLHS